MLAYFLPGRACRLSQLDQLGLSHAFDRGAIWLESFRGPPDQVDGYLHFASPPPADWSPDQWVHSGAVLIASPASGIDARQLRRRSSVPGVAVGAGGQTWIVPFGRDRFTREYFSDLPMREGLAMWHACGRLHEAVGAYRSALVDFEAHRGRLADFSTGALTCLQRAVCAAALGVNYRIAAAELELLEITDDQAGQVASAAAFGFVSDSVTGV